MSTYSDLHRITAKTRIDCLLIIFLLSCFRIPVLFSPVVAQALNAAFIAFFAVQLLLRFRDLLVIKSVYTPQIVLVTTFVALGQISLLRAVIASHMSFSFALTMIVWQWLIIALTTAFVSRAKNKSDVIALLKAALVGIIVYILLNIVLMTAGITAHDYQPIFNWDVKGLIFKTLGLDLFMVQPPLASAPTSIAGVCLFVAICTFPFRGHTDVFETGTMFGFVIAVVSLSLMLFSDSRMALMAFIVASVCILLFSRSVMLYVIKASILLSPVFPFIFIFVASMLQNLEIASILSRNAWDNIATLSNRTYLWADASNVISEINFHTLIGYGTNGQIESGISERTAYIFESRADDKHHTLHNTVIQMYIDRGLIGLFIFLAVFYSLITRVARGGEIGYRIGVGIFSLLLFGQTVSLFIVSPIDSLTLILVLLGLSASSFLNRSYNGAASHSRVAH